MPRTAKTLMRTEGFTAGRFADSETLALSTSTSDQSDVGTVIKDVAIGRVIALNGRLALWGVRHSEEIGSVDEMTGVHRSVAFLGYSESS